MDVRIGCIIEGQGEILALPILLRRVVAEIDLTVRVLPVVARHSRSALVRPSELERAVQAVSYSLYGPSGILILLDADDDPACVLGPTLLQRAQAARPDQRIRVVLAVKEYEAWFLAAADSLAGKSGLPPNLTAPGQPEGIRDAKGWLANSMGFAQTYSPTRHQPSFTAQFDLAAARNASSFDKFYRDISSLITEIKAAA